MGQYINHSKDMIDHLLVSRDTLSIRDQVLYVLRGLDGCYEFLVTIVTNKKKVLSLDELFNRMRTHDKQLERINILDIALIQANYSITKQPFQKAQNTRPTYKSPINQFSSTNTNQGNTKTSNTKFVKNGYSTTKCFFKYNESKNSAPNMQT